MSCLGVAPPVRKDYKGYDFPQFQQKTLKYVTDFYLRVDEEEGSMNINEICKGILTRIDGSQATEDVVDQFEMIILMFQNEAIF